MHTHYGLCTSLPEPRTDVQRGKSKTKQLKRFPLLTIGPSIAYIPLTQGQFALIDADDVERVGANNWYAQWNGNTRSFYAFREITGRKKLGMHAFLLNPPAGLLPDHISGVTLDNRKANLRPATKVQNGMNRLVRRDSRTGLRGVSPKGKRFEAKIKIAGTRKHLGSFDTAQAAYEAYCATAAQHHGEYRRLA